MGSTGAGKTSVLAEASDILALQIVHAAVDLDALGLAHLPSETTNGERRSDIRQSSVGMPSGNRCRRKPCGLLSYCQRGGAIVDRAGVEDFTGLARIVR